MTLVQHSVVIFYLSDLSELSDQLTINYFWLTFYDTIRQLPKTYINYYIHYIPIVGKLFKISRKEHYC